MAIAISQQKTFPPCVLIFIVVEIEIEIAIGIVTLAFLSHVAPRCSR